MVIKQLTEDGILTLLDVVSNAGFPKHCKIRTTLATILLISSSMDINATNSAFYAKA